MWTCPKCKRNFFRASQPHSCHKIPLDQHFKNKEKSREIFHLLVKQIESNVGQCQIISIPCCIHLFGNYDFLAALPKKDGLEIRFALDRKLNTSRLKQCVPMSTKIYKNCLNLTTRNHINDELIKWLHQSYHLKD